MNGLRAKNYCPQLLQRNRVDNSLYDTSDVKKVCETKLKIDFRDAGEYNGWYYFGGRKTCRITVSKGRKFIPDGTYKSMAKQLKLQIKEMDSMLECTLSKSDYDKLLAVR